MTNNETLMRSFAFWREPSLDFVTERQEAKVYKGEFVRPVFEDGTWATGKEIASFPDPYDALMTLARAGLDEPSIMEMWGWITPVDTETAEDKGERVRCCVYVLINKEEATVAVAKKGEDLVVFDDGEGEGMFGDALKSAMMLAKAGL